MVSTTGALGNSGVHYLLSKPLCYPLFHIIRKKTHNIHTKIYELQVLTNWLLHTLKLELRGICFVQIGGKQVFFLKSREEVCFMLCQNTLL